MVVDVGASPPPPAPPPAARSPSEAAATEPDRPVPATVLPDCDQREQSSGVAVMASGCPDVRGASQFMWARVALCPHQLSRTTRPSHHCTLRGKNRFVFACPRAECATVARRACATDA
eukprot:107180-Pleurochrysis_carterae.AAC.2